MLNILWKKASYRFGFKSLLYSKNIGNIFCKITLFFYKH